MFFDCRQVGVWHEVHKMNVLEGDPVHQSVDMFYLQIFIKIVF
jgi:hypothetical protein